MNKSNLFLFLFFLATSLLAKPPYSILDIDSTLLKDAHTVVRMESLELEVINQKKAIERNHSVLSVLNNQSYKERFTIYYDDYNKIKKAYCIVYDAFGNEVKKFNKKDMIDQAAVNSYSLYTDLRVSYIDLRQFAKPFTVECYYELTHEQGFQAYPRWQQTYGESVEEVKVRCILPAAFELQSKSYNIDLESQIETENGKAIHTWEISQLPARLSEPLSPASHQILPMLLLTPKTFELEGYKGSYESWEKFGAFVYEMNANRDQLSPEMESKVKELTRNLKTDQEKIAILYQYLQENTRYVNVSIGIGGWQTYDAQYVEKNKYGDCKALSNFMKAMLKAAGIPSTLTLINSGREAPIAADFPVANFNHMILYVPSEEMWLECTSQAFPSAYPGAHLENRKVLLIDEKGGQLVDLPAITNNRSVHKTAIVLDEKGKAILKNTTNTFGKKHEYLRSYLNRYSSKEERIKAFRENSDFPSFSINEFEINASEKHPEATHDYELEIPKYASKAGKRIFVPLNRLSNFHNLLPEDKDRQYPLVRKSTYEDEIEVSIQIPDSYKIESIPENQTIETEFGTYNFSVELDKNTFRFTRKLQIKAFDLPADRYESVRQFYKEISKLDNAQMVLKQIVP